MGASWASSSPSPTGASTPPTRSPSARSQGFDGDLQVARERLALQVTRLVVALAQDRRRVDRRQHDRREVGVEQAAAFLRDLELVAEQRLGGGRAEHDQRLGADLAQLRVQPGPAGADLAGVGLLVDAPLATLLELEVLDRVGDIGVGAVDAGTRERLV